MLLVLMLVLAPIRVKSKTVVVLHDAMSNREAFLGDDSAAAKYVRTVERVAGSLTIIAAALLLLIGYIAPYAGWYEFEFRIPVLGIVTLGVGVYAWRTMSAFNKARYIETTFVRSREGGTS